MLIPLDLMTHNSPAQTDLEFLFGKFLFNLSISGRGLYESIMLDLIPKKKTQNP